MARKPYRRGRRPVETLTEHQRRTLTEIRDYVGHHGFPPTIQELADGLGISSASAYAQINHLVRKGYLRRESRKARGIVVIREPDSALADLVRIPILGL